MNIQRIATRRSAAQRNAARTKILCLSKAENQRNVTILTERFSDLRVRICEASHRTAFFA